MAKPRSAVEAVKAIVGAPSEQLRERVKQLEAVVEKQAERIERLNKAKFRIPKSPSKSRTSAAFSRIVIPDTHGCFADGPALAAFLKDLESLAPSVKEIVMLGDHLDCGGFLAQHHVQGYVAESGYTFEDDCAATNALLDEIQRLCPSAAIHYLSGNHERRIERWCLTQALKGQDAAFLYRMFSAQSVLHMEARGINFYDQGKFFNGCRIPSTIKLGHCYFTHGSRTGANPAAAMLRDFGCNVVFGHVHRIDMASARTVSGGEIASWSPGCLCRLQPLWLHTSIVGWGHGYGLQLVRSDGDFLMINVPIIDGESYLMQLAGNLS